MTLDQLRRTKKAEILSLVAHFGAHNVRVFGSVARGDATPASDIDLLVDLDADRTLMDLGGLLTALQVALPGSVDVATESMLRPHVRARVMRDAVPL